MSDSSFNSPFEEALTRVANGEENASIPSYMVAGDTLNIGNRNRTFLEAAADTIEDVPKFIAASIIAGTNELYNIPTDIGNLVSGGAFGERSDTGDVIAALDSDLGEFYETNQEGVDLVGFIASSLVPGIAGIKVLNAGQRGLKAAIGSGKYGTNMGRALGVLAPDRPKNLALAIEEVVNSNSAISLLNGSAGKALANGFGQNMLEGIAFEVGVAATMFNSPILENQDLGDLATNIFIGGALFGSLGGVVEAARLNSSLKSAVNNADVEARPWTFIKDTAKISQPYERVALGFEQLDEIPDIPLGLSEQRTNFLRSAAEAKRTVLLNDIRQDMAELANGDQKLAQTLFDTFKAADVNSQKGAFIGLEETSRFADQPKLEKLLDRLSKKVAKGNATTDELDKFASISRSYTKLWGEDAGRVTTEIPVVTQITDLLKSGQNVEINMKRGRIKAGNSEWTFSTDYNFKSLINETTAKTRGGTAKSTNHWDLINSDPLEVNARYVWASNMKKFDVPTGAKPLLIHEHDLPLLEKMMFDLPTPADRVHVRIRSNTKGVSDLPASQLDTVDWLALKKAQIANKLQSASTRGEIGSNPDVVANKLRSLLGVNISVQDLPPGTRGQFVKLIRGEREGFTRIDISKQALTTEPLHKLVQTVLHEEGHSKFDTLLNLGGVPTESLAAIRKELTAISKKARPESWEGAIDGTEYFAYLNDMHELMADSFAMFTQFPELLKKAPTFDNLYGHLTRPLPKELVDSYANKMTKLSQDEIASMVNVKNSWLSGEQMTGGFTKASPEDIFAMQDHTAKYTAKLKAEGALKQDAPNVELWNTPQHAKLTYDTTPFESLDNNVVSNMVIIKEQQKFYEMGTNRAASEALGIFAEQYPDISSGRVYTGANRSGAGAGFITSANGNYGSLAAAVENAGNVTTRAIESYKAAAKETLDPLLYKVVNNKQDAIEWSVLNAKVRELSEPYAFNAAGDALEPIKMLNWKKLAAAAEAEGKAAPPMPKLLQGDSPLRVEIASQNVRDLAKGHIALNGKRTSSLSMIRSAQGVQYKRDPAAFYPIPVNPKDFPFFALVTDESVTGVGHSKTLYATNSADLESQMAKLKQNPQLKIRTKKEAEDYYRSIGQWDYEKTINQNYLDNTAKRSGVSAPFLPPTDPQKIVADTLNWHMERETGTVREAVLAKYEVQFEELRRLGDSFTNTATSRTNDSSLLSYADDAVKNPFADYIKTALAVKKTADYPFWNNINTMSDRAVSSILTRATAAVENAKTSEELLQVNGMLERAGYKGAAYTPDMEIFANVTPDRRLLTETVQKANSILATVVLRLDALNAVNNAVSANVLLGAEIKAVQRAIARGDEEAVGALAALTRIAVPGTDQTIMSPTKLIANAIKKFGTKTPEMQFYKDRGFVTSISDQYASTLDNLSFNGSDVGAWAEKVKGVHNNIAELANTGEKWTGNKLAEEFNRFVAADVMKQMTDVAVERGLMGAKEQLAYINTFVNRTQANYLASQRPGMFQGPIGQAIGLFQTYQFNLIQQMLRHVGEGHAKDAMTLLALQGTIHGMNGLPAFNAVNTHIIGTASGNQEHKDAYAAIYGIAGKEAGDWLTYGVASNALGLIDPDLKINLYTRGDINPRHVTIVPTSPAEVASVQAFGKVMKNIINTAGKIEAGGDFTTSILQGLEHNGISRPLAGLAQTLQGLANPLDASYSTSKKGNVIASNDFLSLANLGRMAGAKPLDEAIALDATFRYKAYALKDQRSREKLGQAIKTTLIAGQNPTQEQIESFAADYAASGGRQQEFSKWMLQLQRTANLSQSNKIVQSLNSPFTQDMQKIMGGRELRDFE